MALEDEFHQRMLYTVEECFRRSEGHPRPYYPTWYKRLVEHRGGVGAAQYLLASFNWQTGLTQLAERGWLDISAEAAVVEPRFKSLFTTKERTEAQRRLDILYAWPLTG